MNYLKKYCWHSATLALIIAFLPFLLIHSMEIEPKLQEKYPYAAGLAKALECHNHINDLSELIDDKVIEYDCKKKLILQEKKYKDIIKKTSYIDFFYNQLPVGRSLLTVCPCNHKNRPARCIVCLSTLCILLFNKIDSVKVYGNPLFSARTIYSNPDKSPLPDLINGLNQWFCSAPETKHLFTKGTITTGWGVVKLDFTTIDDNISLEESQHTVLKILNEEAENIYQNPKLLENVPYKGDSSKQSLSETVQDAEIKTEISVSTQITNTTQQAEQTSKTPVNISTEPAQQQKKIDPSITRTNPSAPFSNADKATSFTPKPKGSFEWKSIFTYLFQWNAWSWISYLNPLNWIKKIL